ncbi:hypothetical protein THAOC_12918 [Thalassiosira oceanica]|uniref:Uncharacterized protein n=1 Tax=Thalassiosira oceanica TaxID=159749 RepID=K0T6Z4_THAOC|nr:hypothetical protein THAOC_12918 [Thalassiosira oceanica]|eukprot:EJK66177.1 hypothetical protein THAOC_12918 [Thalassiosira oceanica]
MQRASSSVSFLVLDGGGVMAEDSKASKSRASAAGAATAAVAAIAESSPRASLRPVSSARPCWSAHALLDLGCGCGIPKPLHRSTPTSAARKSVRRLRDTIAARSKVSATRLKQTQVRLRLCAVLGKVLHITESSATESPSPSQRSHRQYVSSRGSDSHLRHRRCILDVVPGLSRSDPVLSRWEPPK